MNLFAKLQERAAKGNPIRVGMIGAGKFGTMFLAQALRLKGIHIVGVVDLNPGTAKSNMKLVGWEGEAYSAASLDAAAASGATFVGDDWQALIAHPAVEIIIECTGNPIAAVTHALTAFQNGKHVINVTVEADAFVGPGLADKAREAGVIYSMAYGDQPALASDLVDWARACGFSVVAAGRGHKWMPHFRQSTPDTVWDHWGLTREQAERGRLNPKMFNAFLDGSKPAIESAAIANVCGLDAPADGLVFPSGGIDDVPNLARPRAEGGVLDHKGMVDVISCLTPDGAQIPHDIRKGVWVCFEGDTEYLRNCFEEYKVVTDDSGRYMCNYKRWHLIGLELGISVASVGLRGEPTGAAQDFRADVAAVTKRNLKKGEILDGEGGYTVAGGLRPASLSLEGGYVPLGLAHNVTLIRDVPEGQPITWNDIKADTNTDAYRLRQEVETRFSKTAAA
ncbi:putative homoserine dehydrogenase-like protein [Litoreibacter ponti]|uniref:Putative homoserine dehydrogenase-like protein n=1 Tax=Litoreibacter ponti TaxID=1510457 RepID=A0A2T6BCT4_9RHOB|nr:Gfo/Idh/MocA family oxidoreductase [Litoreibacter ponti]PTX53873.1 putative homoserine dehydrogenase-like protein [Litoreibacter ponti]